jgi:hypothetical protein
MKRRWMLVGLALVAIVAIAVPALAGNGGKGGSLLDVSKLAQTSRVKAHHALGVAKKARKRADRALKLARQGGQGGQVGAATGYAETPAAESTGSTSEYVSLGGPSLSITVPQASHAPGGIGLIQVAAQAHVGDDAGAVSLYQDGSPMAGQSELCDQFVGTPGPALFASADGVGGDWGTPASVVYFGGCASPAPAGPVEFSTTPGDHTYELRYAFCGCAGTDATFSQRKLWVTPLS